MSVCSHLAFAFTIIPFDICYNIANTNARCQRALCSSTFGYTEYNFTGTSAVLFSTSFSVFWGVGPSLSVNLSVDHTSSAIVTSMKLDQICSPLSQSTALQLQKYTVAILTDFMSVPSLCLCFAPLFSLMFQACANFFVIPRISS